MKPKILCERFGFASLVAALIIFSATEGFCQESVFGLLKKDTRLASDYFHEKNYRRALDLFESAPARQISVNEKLMMGRCHFFLKEYDKALSIYQKLLTNGETLPSRDLYYHAESQSAERKYDDALVTYKKYLEQAPNDTMVIKKMWRLNNITFLFEDSLHYALRPIPLNTPYGDLCARPYKDGLMFISSRKEVSLVEKIDGSLNTPFYRMYFAKMVADSAGLTAYGKASPFQKALNIRFHSGPVSLFSNNTKVIYTHSGNAKTDNGARNLGLSFAEEIDGVWREAGDFPFNSPAYSVSEPAITNDGRVLYFSSDMPGGYGGKDLYRSEFRNGEWTSPVNLGDGVNTTEDEVFPFLHNNRVLYFSSNGHAGLGGLDIFKAEITDGRFSEVQNAGYPLNTSHDEFGVYMDSLQSHGYVSSNRKNGGYDDDLYEFDIDLQIYPLVIRGLLKYREHSWNDSSELKILRDSKIFVIDNIRNITVYESRSDGDGNFSLTIPYFSKYKVKVISEGEEEHIASLPIPRHRTQLSDHEIVIIKDLFRLQENPVVK
jgi:tetratricopeptide (TPR) repeat protein